MEKRRRSTVARGNGGYLQLPRIRGEPGVVADTSGHYQALRSLPCTGSARRWLRAEAENLQQLRFAKVEGHADGGQDTACDLHPPLHRLRRPTELPGDC